MGFYTLNITLFIEFGWEKYLGLLSDWVNQAHLVLLATLLPLSASENTFLKVKTSFERQAPPNKNRGAKLFADGAYHRTGFCVEMLGFI